MSRLACSRLFFPIALFFFPIALFAHTPSAAKRPTNHPTQHLDIGNAVSDTGYSFKNTWQTPPQSNTAVPLQLAGLPGPDAAPGRRIFLTVRDDVFQNGDLRIAAGARAKGLIRAIRRSATMLYLSLEMQTVQSVDGALLPLAAEPVELEIPLTDAGARYWPLVGRVGEGPAVVVR